jgi:hypothetical protein
MPGAQVACPADEVLEDHARLDDLVARDDGLALVQPRSSDGRS